MNATRITRHSTILTIVIAGAALALAACNSPDKGTQVGGDTPSTPSPSRTTATPEALPPDGRQLFDFLLAKIPKLVAKVPCSCCPYSLAQCYRGACPTSCGPCNRIGRQVYKWHVQGVSDDDIISRVKIRWPRRG